MNRPLHRAMQPHVLTIPDFLEAIIRPAGLLPDEKPEDFAVVRDAVILDTDPRSAME
jgi:hypothetical protein